MYADSLCLPPVMKKITKQVAEKCPAHDFLIRLARFSSASLLSLSYQKPVFFQGVLPLSPDILQSTSAALEGGMARRESAGAGELSDSQTHGLQPRLSQLLNIKDEQ